MYLEPCETHCVKSVRIQNFSSPYFPARKLNMERFFVEILQEIHCFCKKALNEMFGSILNANILKFLASTLWWNSQTLAIKITIVAVASLLLIILILSIIYCRLRHQSNKGQEVAEDKVPVDEEKGVVVEKHPVDVDSKKSKFPEPDENQFKYTLYVNDVA